MRHAGQMDDAVRLYLVGELDDFQLIRHVTDYPVTVCRLALLLVEANDSVRWLFATSQSVQDMLSNKAACARDEDRSARTVAHELTQEYAGKTLLMKSSISCWAFA